MPALASQLSPSRATKPRQADADVGGAALCNGPAREALRRAMHQLGLAEAASGPARAAALCSALTEAAQALAGLRAYGAAESYLLQALRWAGQAGGSDQAAELHCALAELAGQVAALDAPPARCRAARERARDHAFEAARLAALATDPAWERRLLQRAGVLLASLGDLEDAQRLQRRARPMAAPPGCDDSWQPGAPS